MSELVVDTLWIYGLAAAVSLLIAALIKLIVVLLGRVDRPAAVVAPPPARAGKLQRGRHVMPFWKPGCRSRTI